MKVQCGRVVKMVPLNWDYIYHICSNQPKFQDFQQSDRAVQDGTFLFFWERTIQCGALAATPMATLALGSAAMKKRICNQLQKFQHCTRLPVDGIIQCLLILKEISGFVDKAQSCLWKVLPMCHLSLKFRPATEFC